MNIRRAVGTAGSSVLVSAALLAGFAAPAQAAADVDVVYGNTRLTGQLNFTNRSVILTGTLRVTAGSCRYVALYAQVVRDDGAETVTVGSQVSDRICNTASSTRDFPVTVNTPAPVAGGANFATVRIADQNGAKLVDQGYVRQ